MLDSEMAEYSLRARGARMTAQRKAVMLLLDGNRTHPTADTIIELVREKLGCVAPATIYNTLDALEKLGLVRRIDGLESRAHFDPDTSEHQHAICLKCKVVWDVEVTVPQIGFPDRFKVSNVLIQGTCAECAVT